MDEVPLLECSSENNPSTALTCCCGHGDCPFLAHSSKILYEVERDAQKAGELGQALLHRHESYVADAEQDRRRMLENIAHLEHEKQSLEARNAHMIEENRRLLDELETLNAAVAESDSRVLSLAECLRSADAQIDRLTGLAARTDLLQTQLARFEDEQAALQATLAITKDDERTAILRFQRAERTITNLQEQMDSIEREAREERERHVEVVGRMERRRAVEMELQTAAGRLRGAAASKTMSHDKNGSSVVSHFVKDILQDNANLQLGIVELKEMLDRSNDEVEKLRQMMAQQGVQESPRSPMPNLGAELGTKELHVHHHYHAPPTTVVESKTPRKEVARRSRKRRISLTTGHFAPPSGTHTPRSSISASHSRNASSTASAILSQTSVSIPNHRKSQRWSMQSNQTGFTSGSSVPSSPYGESVFDRILGDSVTDASRPTSPESNGTLSPFAVGPIDHKSLGSVPRFSLEGGMRTVSEGAMPLSQQLTQQLSGTVRIGGKGKAKRESAGSEHDPWQTGYHSIILEENEEHDANHPIEPQTESEEQYDPTKVMQPRLRRATSHESLISVSGMDIHTLQSRPSQLFASRRILSSSSSMTSQPVLTGTSAMAIQSSSRQGHSDSRSYLSSIAQSQRKPGLEKKSSMGNLGSKVGWVFGMWGYAASPLSSTAGAETASISSDSRTIDSSGSGSKAVDTLPPPLMPNKLRPPGINQPGPIFGFGPEPQLPQEVVVKAFDEEALRDSLGASE